MYATKAKPPSVFVWPGSEFFGRDNQRHPADGETSIRSTEAAYNATRLTNKTMEKSLYTETFSNLEHRNT